MNMRIVKLPSGAPVVDSVRAEAKGTSWVRATGQLTEALLRAPDGRLQALEGDGLVLASLEGLGEGELMAIVSAHDALGARLVAGELVHAIARGPLALCVWSPAEPAPLAASPAPAASEPAMTREPHAREVPAARPSEPALFREPERPKPLTVGLGQPIPARPVRAVAEVEEPILPDAGDRVEHFAFGTCEVLKSDGDRLHLRLERNGATKEIAVEMLRVTLLPDDGTPGRHFKLERKL